MKKLGIIWDDKRFWMHFVLFFLGAWLPPFALLSFTYLFTQYEASEDTWIKDKAYIDLQGSFMGLLVGGLIETGLIVWLIVWILIYLI